MKILALSILLTASTSFSQGLYWESTIVDDQDTVKSHTYYMPRMYKEIGRNDGKTIVVRLDKQMFIMIDDSAREYTEMTFAQMERVITTMMSQFAAQKTEMEKQLANLPPEERKQVEELMKAQMPGQKPAGKIEVEKPSGTTAISGYDCGKNILKRDGKTFLTIWSTHGIEGLETYNAEMKEFGKRMASLNPLGDMAELEAMVSVEGFPMKTEYDGSTTTVTSVERKAIPASEFEPPAGYKKVEPELPVPVDTVQHR